MLASSALAVHPTQKHSTTGISERQSEVLPPLGREGSPKANTCPKALALSLMSAAPTAWDSTWMLFKSVKGAKMS